MYDFAAQQVTESTLREYTFDMIPGAPSIWTAPAHDSNEAYLDERLRMSIAAAERALAAPRGTPGKPERQTPQAIKEQIEQEREDDRLLLSKTCANRWGTAPVATDGTRPDLTPETCYAFFKALPVYLFDPFRNFCGNLYNFVPRPDVTEAEAAKLGN